MKIDTKQAASILGVSPSSVHTLVKKGLLKDVSGKNGKRHHQEFEIKEVKEFKKNHKFGANTGLRHQNGKLPLEPEVKPHAISERLKRLEEKIDHLIGIWS